jgi:heme/copper-type cytochrome/quinol oxidase subunit 3
MLGRPIGVILLSCLAFLTSAISGVVAFLVFYQILLFFRHSPQSRTEDVQPLAYVLVPLAWICVITLAGIAFTAGIDLWRMKNRGRKLAITSMILLLPLGILFALASNEYEHDIKITAVGVCIVCSASILYLFFPRVRIMFAKKIDSA